MAARRTPRPARMARPARAARQVRANPRATVVPSVDVRRRRGPKPPDHVVAALGAALRLEWGARADAALPPEGPPPKRLSARWRAALLLALAALGRAARRGVLAALGAAGVTAPDPVAGKPDPAWPARVTAAVLAAGTLAGAIAAIEALVFLEHARLVRAIAIAAGANEYIWTTRLDPLVRELHEKLEGTIQRWDTPPLAGLPNFHGHPGEAAGPCRCTAFPVITRRRPPRT